LKGDAVAVEESGGALWVTLQRPPLNVLDIPAIRELHDVLLRLASRRDLKVLVLRSSLDGTFSAGVDIRDHARDRVVSMLDAFHRIFRLLDALPQATLAAVDGRCLGGGCELASFCDVVLATPRAAFALPEIDVGCFPPVAASWLTRISFRAASELILTGALWSAAEAARMGLVSRVVNDLEVEVRSLVARLAGKSGAVLSLARKALRQGGHGSFAEALARTEEIYRKELLPTQDVEEGVRAFLEKRKPRWTDR
jgi:cyclohexa-1,5-dienecarbonyl-CoA hydratase